MKEPLTSQTFPSSSAGRPIRLHALAHPLPPSRHACGDSESDQVKRRCPGAVAASEAEAGTQQGIEGSIDLGARLVAGKLRTATAKGESSVGEPLKTSLEREVDDEKKKRGIRRRKRGKYMNVEEGRRKEPCKMHIRLRIGQ